VIGDGPSFREWRVSAELLGVPAAAKLKHLFGTKARSPATEQPPGTRELSIATRVVRHTSRTDYLEPNVDVTARSVRVGTDLLVRFLGERGELALGQAPILDM